MADATAASATVGWLPVFTLLLGAGITLVATVITSLLQHRLTSQRERETRRELRRDQLAERRADFQRQTLVDLQDALMDMGRSTGEMHHADRMAYVKSGEWQTQQYPDVLSEKNRIAYARTTMLSGTVRDSAVRDLVKEFKNLATKMTESDSPPRSDREWEEMVSIDEESRTLTG